MPKKADRKLYLLWMNVFLPASSWACCIHSLKGTLVKLGEDWVLELETVSTVTVTVDSLSSINYVMLF